MSDNIDHLSRIIDHYATSARDSTIHKRTPMPIAEQRVPTHDQLAPADTESIASIRARAAVIAREEERDSTVRPDVLGKDTENKTVVTRIAIGGAALLLTGLAAWGISEVKQKVDGFTDHINELATSQITH